MPSSRQRKSNRSAATARRRTKAKRTSTSIPMSDAQLLAQAERDAEVWQRSLRKSQSA